MAGYPAGSRVRVRTGDPDHHTRVPRYVRGHTGEVVAMPITGRPSKTSGVKPWLRIQPRYAMPDRPVAPNHCVLRSAL